jgi:hypothetical protein
MCWCPAICANEERVRGRFVAGCNNHSRFERVCCGKIQRELGALTNWTDRVPGEK